MFVHVAGDGLEGPKLVNAEKVLAKWLSSESIGEVSDALFVVASFI